MGANNQASQQIVEHSLGNCRTVRSETTCEMGTVTLTTVSAQSLATKAESAVLAKLCIENRADMTEYMNKKTMSDFKCVCNGKISGHISSITTMSLKIEKTGSFEVNGVIGDYQGGTGKEALYDVSHISSIGRSVMIKPLPSKGEIIEYKKELVAIILSSAKAINESTKKKWQELLLKDLIKTDSD